MTGRQIMKATLELVECAIEADGVGFEQHISRERLKVLSDGLIRKLWDGMYDEAATPGAPAIELPTHGEGRI